MKQRLANMFYGFCFLLKEIRLPQQLLFLFPGEPKGTDAHQQVQLLQAHLRSFNEILQMAQNAQAELQKAQDNLDQVEVEGVAGGGLVKVRATAKGRIIAVELDQSLLVPAEKAMLEDLIAAAFNDAKAKSDTAAATEMQKMQSSLPLPPGFKLPF